MAHIIELPTLGEQMTHASVSRWHKAIGDYVSEFELLAEVETEKATLDLESAFSGYVLFLADPDTSLPVGSILAILGEKEEDIQELLKNSAPVSPPELSLRDRIIQLLDLPKGISDVGILEEISQLKNTPKKKKRWF